MEFPELASDDGILVCGHGSRNAGAVQQFQACVEALRARAGEIPLEYGFLEFATPILRDGLDRLRAQGCRRVLALPGMLFAAGHAKNDIPSVLNRYGREHGGMEILYGRELGLDARMVQAAGARVREAMGACGAEGREAYHRTLLVVVGRGSSDPDANSQVSKLTRLLWEGLGFGWAETVYSGVTFPLVAPGLERAMGLGFSRVLVFPYFLFTGILVERIYTHTDQVAAQHPDVEIVKAGYLNDHPLVLDTLVSKLAEVLRGENVMNCALCKYREQILGFEDEVGLAQQSHHHHVEGGHHHHHHHDEGGHHHPYPHGDHPLGPVTLKG